MNIVINIQQVGPPVFGTSARLTTNDIPPQWTVVHVRKDVNVEEDDESIHWSHSETETNCYKLSYTLENWRTMNLTID